MNIEDLHILRDLFFVFGIILIIGGIYIVGTAGMPGSDVGWTRTRALQLAYDGWDIALFIVGTCLFSSAIIFHFRAKEEDRLS
jgi:hypothetical protein